MAVSPDEPKPPNELRPEYDFRAMRGVVRGKYAARYVEGTVVVFASDAAKLFPDSISAKKPVSAHVTSDGRFKATIKKRDR